MYYKEDSKKRYTNNKRDLYAEMEHEKEHEKEQVEEEVDETDETEENIFRLYLNDVGRYDLLSKAEERELVDRAQNGDIEAQNRLIQCNQRYVISIAKKFQGCGLTLLELIQEGNIGLIKAISRYDYNRGALTTYSKDWIEKYIKQALDENTENTINFSLNMKLDKEDNDDSEEFEEITRNPDEIPLERIAIENQMGLDLAGGMEYMRTMHFDDPKENTVCHILTNEFCKSTITALRERAGISVEEFDIIAKRILNKAAMEMTQDGYVVEQTDPEEFDENQKELKQVPSGETTVMAMKQEESILNLIEDEEIAFEIPSKCWEFDVNTFPGSDREARLFEELRRIKGVDCKKYILKYLQEKYGTTEEKSCMKCLKADYKNYGVIPSKPKGYFPDLLRNLNETNLNEMALATKMDMKKYSMFRKKVIKCSESDFTKKEYIFMYLTLKYASFCGMDNYREAYDQLVAIYEDTAPDDRLLDQIMDNMYEASRVIGNGVLYHLENGDQLKSEYKDLLFTQKIDKLEDLIKKTMAIQKKKLIRSSEELFHMQWKELRQNIVQYDGHDILVEYNEQKAAENKKKSKQLNIDREYIRRALYGVKKPNKKAMCQIGGEECFLNTEDFHNTLIHDDNIITDFAKKTAKMKRNLILSLLLANFGYKIQNSTRISDDYEERLNYFEDRVYREFSTCGYMALNNENAYDAYLKLLLTCAQPLELSRYLWMQKLGL